VCENGIDMHRDCLAMRVRFPSPALRNRGVAFPVAGRQEAVVLTVIAMISMAAVCSTAACSSADDRASPEAAGQLRAGADQPLTLTPGQLLAATNGATPVAFAHF
jgi:hypothetical protein